MHGLSWIAVLVLNSGEGITLQDGQEIAARILALDESGLRVEGRAEPIGLYELRELRFSAASGGELAAEDFSDGPIVRFRSGETAHASVLKATEASALVEFVARGGDRLCLEVPLECIEGFRLRGSIKDDPLFEKDLQEGPPALRPEAPARRAPGAESEKEEPGGAAAPLPRDTIYVLRPTGALRAEGRFRSLDETYLTLTMEGQLRRVRREILIGAILAPAASAAVETEVPAVIETNGAGRIPVFLRRIDGAPPERRITFRFPGARPDEVVSVPESWVQRISLSSDRVLFLSNLNPVRVEETPVLGDRVPFPWKRDFASSGSPLRIGGRRYSKGIGMHPSSSLEFQLDAKFRALAGVAGLDDSAAEGASAKFRILADGKEIFSKVLKKEASGKAPDLQSISLPIDGVRRLRLEVEHAEEGFVLGAHADWADIRVTR